jgi:hypothetical protein
MWAAAQQDEFDKLDRGELKTFADGNLMFKMEANGTVVEVQSAKLSNTLEQRRANVRYAHALFEYINNFNLATHPIAKQLRAVVSSDWVTKKLAVKLIRISADDGATPSFNFQPNLNLNMAQMRELAVQVLFFISHVGSKMLSPEIYTFAGLTALTAQQFGVLMAAGQHPPAQVSWPPALCPLPMW